MGLIESYERAFEGSCPEDKKFLVQPLTAQRLKAKSARILAAVSLSNF